MAAALMALGYLPDILWFADFMKHEPVFIEREENFVKSTFRNRCEIAGAGGKQALTIPIIGGRDHHQKYKEVKIAYQVNWQHQHWQSIRSAYGSAPFFEFYISKFEKFYEKEFEPLFDFNLELLRELIAMLKIKKTFDLTSSYKKEMSGGIDLRFASSKNQIPTPRYYQVFEERNGFIPNLSILDLLFHLGPEAKSYLEAPRTL